MTYFSKSHVGNKGVSAPYLAQRQTKMMQNSRRDMIKKDFEADVSELNPIQQLENLNINTGYLLTILRLIDQFSITKINGIGGVGKDNPDYYYQLYELLEMLLDMLYCKMKPEDKQSFQKRLDRVYKNIEMIFKETENGVFINKVNSMRLRRDIVMLFRDLLDNMEKRGMLTYKTDDPKFSMGKFSD